MGVNHLWTILAPVEKHQSLKSLKGKTLAVDLSMWVVENQSVKELDHFVNKPYLRNLFFRVSHLLQLEIQPVFVFEGTAPCLKLQTMIRRDKIRYGTHCEKTLKKKNRNRPQFQAQLRECHELLQLMGVPCIPSSGEAEAMCAYLNEKGLVDGCITDDSDAFLYGARTVYRNFTMNAKDPHVNCYEMSDIESTLNLNRRSLVGLALLLGCDYLPQGVPGIGKEQAMKFLNLFQGMDLLQRFEEWKKEMCRDFESQTCSVYKPEKSKNSVIDEATILTGNIQQPEGNPLENKIKTMALQIIDFPNHQVIDEFLNPRDKAPPGKFNWCRPDFKLQNFHNRHFGWSSDYSLKKIFPLISLWDMKDIIGAKTNSQPLKPQSIIKTRIINGIQCFEVKWCFKESQVWQTVEKKILFEAAFPNIVKEFAASCESKKKRQKVKCKIPVSAPDDGLINPIQIPVDTRKLVKNINVLKLEMKDLSLSADVTSQVRYCKNMNPILQFQMEKENFKNHSEIFTKSESDSLTPLPCNLQYQQYIQDYNQKIEVNNLHETNQKGKAQAYFDLTSPKRVTDQTLGVDSSFKNIPQPMTCNLNSSSDFEMDLTPLSRRIDKYFKSPVCIKKCKKPLIKKSKSEEHLQLMIDLQFKSDENIEMSSAHWDSDIWQPSDLSPSFPRSNSVENGPKPFVFPIDMSTPVTKGHLRKSFSMDIFPDISLEKAMLDMSVLEDKCKDQDSYSRKNDFDLPKKYFQNENSVCQNFAKENSDKKIAIQHPLKDITNDTLAPSVGSSFPDYTDIPLADRLKFKLNAAIISGHNFQSTKSTKPKKKDEVIVIN